MYNHDDDETIPVEGPEDTSSQSLLDELLPRLSGEDEECLYNCILTDYREGLSDRAPWTSRLAEWERQYHGILPTKTYPWPGCSNFHVPLTMLGVETLKPRLISAVIGSDQIVMARPTEAMDEERRDKTELFLNWQLKSQLKIEPLVEESAHSFLIPGVVFAKIPWRSDRRKIRALRRFPLSTKTPDIFRVLFGPSVPEDFKEVRANEWEGRIKTPGGAPRNVTAKFQATKDELLVLVTRDEIVFEGPKPELIAPEDIIVPVNGGGDAQKLPWLQHRQYLYEDQLRSKVKSGRFYQDAVEELVNAVAGVGTDGQYEDEVHLVRADVEGVETQAGTDVRECQYEILEDYRCYDIDDDGMGEEIIVWVSPQLPGRLLGWDYLDNVCMHGKRPFVVGRYMPQPGRFYCPNFAEVIRGIQEEINTMHNQRVDFGTITNAPRFFYRASSTLGPSLMRTRPGDGIPVDDPTRDISIPNWNGSPAFGMAEENMLYQYFERVTGLTDLSLGRQPNRVGATRTASGTNALLSEGSLRFETAMKAFQRFWIEIFEHILALDSQYLPPGIEFRVTGRLPEVIRIDDRSELLGNYDLILAGTSDTLNRQSLREDATVKLNAALSPVALQLGIIGKKGLYRLYKNFFRSYGELDPDLVLEPSVSVEVHTPEQELELWVDGLDARPSPMENLPQHLEAHMGQLKDPDVRRVLGPEGVRKLQKHLSETMQLAQTQALAAQMQAGRGPAGGPVAGPQAMNAQIGRSAPGNPTQISAMPMEGMAQPKGAGYGQ